jgi:hypothetical protein
MRSTSAAERVATAQERSIDEARRVLRPIEVALGDRPKWLGPRIAAFRRKHDLGAMSVSMAFENTVGLICPEPYWLDHWGRCRKGSAACCYAIGDILVAEPYNFYSATAKSLDIFCKKLDLEWHVSSNSWWYPGSTVRIEIHPKSAKS